MDHNLGLKLHLLFAGNRSGMNRVKSINLKVIKIYNLFVCNWFKFIYFPRAKPERIIIIKTDFK